MSAPSHKVRRVPAYQTPVRAILGWWRLKGQYLVVVCIVPALPPLLWRIPKARNPNNRYRAVFIRYVTTSYCSHEITFHHMFGSKKADVDHVLRASSLRYERREARSSKNRGPSFSPKSKASMKVESRSSLYCGVGHIMTRGKHHLPANAESQATDGMMECDNVNSG